jgi:hypothetical protein
MIDGLRTKLSVFLAFSARTAEAPTCLYRYADMWRGDHVAGQAVAAAAACHADVDRQGRLRHQLGTWSHKCYTNDKHFLLANRARKF